MKLKQILFTMMVFQYTVLSHAAVNIIQKKETEIVKKYNQSDFYEINTDFMQSATQLINENARSSYHYDFPMFTDELHLSIHYPEDRQFKIYTFDVGGGGTMGEYQSYIQFPMQMQSGLIELDTGYVQKIDTLILNNTPLYLVQSYYKGSSCVGTYSIQAFRANHQKLIKADIFHTNTKTLNEILIDYDCHKDTGENEPYIQLSQDKKTLNLQFINAKGMPQAKQIRYVLKPKGYVYQGIYKK